MSLSLSNDACSLPTSTQTRPGHKHYFPGIDILQYFLKILICFILSYTYTGSEDKKTNKGRLSDSLTNTFLMTFQYEKPGLLLPSVHLL